MRRALPWVIVAAASAACASLDAWPLVMTIGDTRARPVARGEWIEDYRTALASVAALMKDELGLPAVQGALVFYRDRAAFRAALEQAGYSVEAARMTAETLTAVGGHRRVLINDEGLRDAPWLVRIALIAHELTHTVQYEWSGGVRGTSDQWLREGFAEWVEVQALTRLGFTTPASARNTVLRRIRDAGGARAFPPLRQMVTFPDWVALAQRFDQEAFYGHAWMATQLLIDRHGVAKVISYFERFAQSDDRLANFREAFGEDLSQFETAAAASLAR